MFDIYGRTEYGSTQRAGRMDSLLRVLLKFTVRYCQGYTSRTLIPLPSLSFLPFHLSACFRLPLPASASLQCRLFISLLSYLGCRQLSGDCPHSIITHQQRTKKKEKNSCTVVVLLPTHSLTLHCTVGELAQETADRKSHSGTVTDIVLQLLVLFSMKISCVFSRLCLFHSLRYSILGGFSVPPDIF